VPFGAPKTIIRGEKMDAEEREQELEILNPQIKEVSVGTRKLRKIKIYPMSAGDQLKLIGLIRKVREDAGELASRADTATIIGYVGDVITNNFGTILEFITDDGAKLIDELTNTQISEIADIVYEVNFAILEKKMMAVLQTVLKNTQSLRSLPVSSEITPSTDLKTSSENDTEMGE
jgi:hypothetical protein